MLFCRSYTFFSKSVTHYLTNFLKSLTFISDFAHTPSFFITQPHVGALISKVKKEHPAILKRHIILVFTGTASFEAKIKVNAIPIAPLNPPYVKAHTSFHFNP